VTVRIYLDSCLIIYFVESPGNAGIPMHEAISGAPEGAAFGVSSLVWLECLVKPLWQDNEALIRKFQAALEEFDCLTMSHETYLLAAELRARHGLKTPDALHVACAIANGCDEFWTNDDRLAKLSDRIKTRKID
jgi:uncharacterized protein